ncbi:MAG: bifunctional adenosylcobinamide kinase/adenosylcobinamide-phosphate guanylyltransferase [Lachnospiraceae bacterium]|nr:bifunctional adenosylcobinamide kinase/adenosylcobinamide-phosphate guanylyltransferase [Lachnospiraceae bacterium]
MMVTVTGGSGSGKSEYAENILAELVNKTKEHNKLYYIATMKPYGEDAARCIERHHKLREGKGFITIECYNDIDNCILDSKSNVLLECMSNLAANEMFGETIKDKYYVCHKICNGIDRLKKITDNLVIVTNDIFAGGVVYDKSTMEYMELLGMVNQYLLKISDRVVEVIYSCPLVII